jgi:hypothetical protein
MSAIRFLIQFIYLFDGEHIAEVLKMIDYFLLPACMESHLSGFHNLLWVNLDLDGFGGFPMSSSS